MVKCLIVDDEPLAQLVLEKYISATDGFILVGKCFTATDAFAVLHEQSIDLLFLDIKMPGVSGIQFIQSLKTPPAFIFTTAFPDHALVSYELEAVDYLLKPITYERFLRSVGRFIKQQVGTTTSDNMETGATPVKDYLYIKVDGNLVKVYLLDLLYAQAMKDYIKVFTSHGQYLTHCTMKALLELLPADVFRRIHRSYIINTQHIAVMGKDVVTIGNTAIPIGENFKGNLSL